MKLRAIAIALLALSLSAACSSDSEVGDESSLAFDQEQAEQFGATTTTTVAGATETTAPTETTTTVAASETTLPPEQQQVTIDVGINDQSPYFDPGLVQVPLGSKVRFTNNGASEHSVVSDTGLFDSGPIPPGGAWIYDATTAGSFNYSDAARPFAVGTIEVS